MAVIKPQIAQRDRDADGVPAEHQKARSSGCNPSFIPWPPSAPWKAAPNAQIDVYGSSPTAERKRVASQGHLRKEVPHECMHLLRKPDRIPTRTTLAKRSGRMAAKALPHSPRPSVPSL